MNAQQHLQIQSQIQEYIKMMYPKSANGGPTSGSNAAGGPAG